MYHVEFYAAARLALVDEGLSNHEAGRRFGIDRRTMKKMPSYSAPPGFRRTAPVRRPKLDGFTGIVDAVLEADRDVPRKKRHTAHRIFGRLPDEHGSTGNYTIVNACEHKPGAVGQNSEEPRSGRRLLPTIKPFRPRSGVRTDLWAFANRRLNAVLKP